MDFTFSAQDETFRRELRQFYKDELPSDWTGANDEGAETHAISQRLRKKLADKGWLTSSWPKEYGGRDAPITTQLVIAEESAYARFSAREQGVGFLGPAIIQHGTEEQKRKFLPPISRAEIVFHQGFSEPDAGSDLAGLKTTAKRDGDFYVINGQKIWGGNLRFADYSFLLARTDQEAPKHKGLSLLVIPADTPGLRYEEFGNLGGGTQNIAYYDDCRVPVHEALIGEENQGWYTAMAVLNHERVVLEYSSMGRRLLDDVIGAWEMRRAGSAKSGMGPVMRNKLAQAAVELEVARMLVYRIAWLEGRGTHATFEASEFRLFGTEMIQRFTQTASELLGLYAQVTGADAHPQYVTALGAIEHLYRYAVSFTIMGGTAEVQRTVIASQGLGLPRGN